LIQKEQNRINDPELSDQKSLFPALASARTMSFKPCGMNDGLVYLTWTTHVRFKGDMILRPARPKNHLRFRRTRPSEIAAHSQQPNMVDFVSL
jgi:hypothetical protein